VYIFLYGKTYLVRWYPFDFSNFLFFHLFWMTWDVLPLFEIVHRSYFSRYIVFTMHPDNVWRKNPYFTLIKLLPYLMPKLKFFPICHLFPLLFPIWHLCHFFAVTALSPRQKDHLAPRVFSCMLCSWCCIFFCLVYLFADVFSRYAWTQHALKIT